MSSRLSHTFGYTEAFAQKRKPLTAEQMRERIKSYYVQPETELLEIYRQMAECMRENPDDRTD